MMTPFKVDKGVVTFTVTRRNGKVYETTISEEDLQSVLDNFTCVCVSQHDSTLFKAVGKTIDGKVRLLHRFLMNAPPDLQVNHIDGNRLNNCRENLRLATNQQNNQNRVGAYSNNKCGIRGVFWNKKLKKWIAHIKVNYKYMHLGCFEWVCDAEEAVMEARAKYMPFSQEGTERARLWGEL